MYREWLDRSGVLLGSAFPLPLAEPFTAAMALEAGCSRKQLQVLVAKGFVRRVVRGVYAASQAPDSVQSRARALALVIPEHAVLTGRTAGWLHGLPVLQRGARVNAPPLELSCTTQSRSVRREVEGHRRMLAARDITVLHGVRVTTPVRTCLDLGRLSWQFDALAALDAGLRAGVDPSALRDELPRFRGYRGVRQLRWLLELADRRAESPGESALRLHWLLAGLPPPTPQLWVNDGDYARYRLDLGLPEIRFAVEYDGLDFHGSDRAEHDRARREWLAGQGWLVVVVGKDEVYGRDTDIAAVLRDGLARARAAAAIWTP